uniref:Uncharacterized protein n=1 Tax=Ixodes ricinus TaxID=34613 RepID=A0A6B0UHA2_IXORI
MPSLSSIRSSRMFMYSLAFLSCRARKSSSIFFRFSITSLEALVMEARSLRSNCSEYFLKFLRISRSFSSVMREGGRGRQSSWQKRSMLHLRSTRPWKDHSQ